MTESFPHPRTTLPEHVRGDAPTPEPKMITITIPPNLLEITLNYLKRQLGVEQEYLAYLLSSKRPDDVIIRTCARIAHLEAAIAALPKE